MSEQHAHPVALRPGDKVLVEAKFTGMDNDGDVRAMAKTNEGEIPCYADPATVHPASVLEDLRAEVADLKQSRKESWDIQRDWAVAMEQLWRFVEPDGCSRSLPNDYMLSIMAAIQEAQDELRKQVTDARGASEGLRAKLAAAEATSSKLAERIDEQIAARSVVEKERDTARRELAEEWPALSRNPDKSFWQTEVERRIEALEQKARA